MKSSSTVPSHQRSDIGDEAIPVSPLLVCRHPEGEAKAKLKHMRVIEM